MSKVIFNSVLAALLLAGCGDDASMADAGGPDAPGDAGAGPDVRPADGSSCEAPAGSATYAFESRYEPGVSSVSYSGQIFRHLLVQRLDAFIDGLGEDVDSGRLMTAESVRSALDFFYRFDGDANGDEPIGLDTDPPALQRTWNDVAAGKDLAGKTAGNDDVTDHRDWDGGDFRGWSDTSIHQGEPIDSPQELIEALFDALARNAALRAEGSQPTGPDGEALPVYVTADGLDLKELIEKTLWMAVAFSQGTDDYLDDDVEGKGLRSPNTRDGDAAHTVLEHAWDEGFGYFGAPRDYDQYSDDELASKGGRPDWQGMHDTSGDCRIDLLSEVAFGASINAAKRDRAAAEPTDFTADAFGAFVAGRALIARAGEALTAEELDELRAHRDRAVQAWEAAIAATVVHYLNEVVADMDALGSDEYALVDHAKHWSELKGFALGLQFNPRSPLHAPSGAGTLFEELHGLLGDRPVLADGAVTVAAYRANLLRARALMRQAYGFSAANVEAW